MSTEHLVKHRICILSLNITRWDTCIIPILYERKFSFWNVMGPLSHSRIQIWAQDRLISNLFSVFSFLPHCLHQEDEEEEEKGVKSIHKMNRVLPKCRRHANHFYSYQLIKSSQRSYERDLLPWFCVWVHYSPKESKLSLGPGKEADLPCGIQQVYE